jgi:hypothetical protein
MQVYIRARPVPSTLSSNIASNIDQADKVSYLEFFLVYNEESVQKNPLNSYGPLSYPDEPIKELSGLSFSKKPLERFESRIKAKFSISSCLGPDITKGFYTAFTEFESTRPYYTPESIWLSLKFVESQVNEKPAHRTKKDIVRDGVWCTFSDFIPRGGSPDIAGYEDHMKLLENFNAYQKVTEQWPTVAHRATFMGIPIKSEVYRLLYAHMDEIYSLARSADFNACRTIEPRVVYHGTAEESLKSIFQHGLRVTYGMFGSAIYFGSFWKACRFSYMTKEYEKRPGAILRCLAFWKDPALWSIRSDKCACAECFGKKGHADHLGLWKAKSHWVLAYPEFGGPIKNEEYACVDSSRIFIDTFGTIECKEKHHEPWDRSQCIN